MTKEIPYPLDAAALPTGSILFTVRYVADEQRIVVCDSRGDPIMAPGSYLKATHGEFTADVVDAILRSQQDDAGYEDPHDIAEDYRDVITGMVDKLDTRLRELNEEQEQSPAPPMRRLNQTNYSAED